MKKIILILTIFFSFMLVTKAEETFKYDWSTKAEVGQVYPVESDSVYYENGYLFTEVEEKNPNTTLKRYDMQGNVILEKEFEDAILFRIHAYGENLYGYKIAIEQTQDKFFLIKLDKNLNITKEVELTEEEQQSFIEDSLYLKRYNLEEWKSNENTITIFGSEGLLKFDKDLNNISIVELEESVIQKEYPAIYEFITWEEDEENYYVSFDMKNTLYVSGGETYDCSQNSSDCNVYGKIKAYNERTLWEKVFKEYDVIKNIKIINQYIVGIGSTCNYRAMPNAESRVIPYNCNTDILIFNLEGELIQKISNENKYTQLQPSPSGFSVLATEKACDYYYPYQGLQGQIGVEEAESFCGNVHFETYYLPLSIITKTDGNGSIRTTSKAKYGEAVTFEVIPEEGYVLGVVKVTDVDGNVVTFTSNTFTMPSSDVTIEAVFVPENPDTGAFITYIIIFVGLLILLSFGIRKERKKFYRI